MDHGGDGLGPDRWAVYNEKGEFVQSRPCGGGERMERIMSICLQAGEILLRSGAETARVEETISRLARAAGVSKVESFVTPTGIFICLERDGESLTRLARVYDAAVDLQKVSAVNDLSRRFVRGEISLEELEEALRLQDRAPFRYPWWVRSVAAFSAAGAYGFLLTGHWRDVWPSALGGLAAHMASAWNGFGRGTGFLRTVLGGFVGSAVAVAVALSEGDQARIGQIVVGAMIPLVPGVAVTTAIRDLLAGDLLSGMARGTEALLTAAAIAMAVAATIGVML